MNRLDLRRRTGFALAAVTLLVFGVISVVLDPVEVRRTPVDPTAAPAFYGDEATYYLIGQSLVHDFDLQYRAEDIARARQEFPQGPSGVFLKRGTTDGQLESGNDRLFFGKSFVYPLFAAPFVAVFGTNGFHVFNAVLLALGMWCAYWFLSARSTPAVSAVLAAGFLIPTVVPIYWAWIAPELFNCIVGLVAYFFWLYKFVAPEAPSPAREWLRGPWSDAIAALLIGILTFSKVSNALLGVPIGLWWLWHREWRRAAVVAATFVVTAGVFFGVNAAVSGDWNYQGSGGRATCYGTYPFETAGQNLDVCDPRATDKAMTDIWFDREVFWSNLRANLGYFVVGRYGGVLPYFFPLFFAPIALALSGRKQRSWQWIVFASVLAQGLLFLITQPYSYFGDGGSVGNRYLMGGYGIAVFMLPPIVTLRAALVPWLVGGIFMAPMLLTPFDTSARPGDRAFRGPLRLLPPELTNFNALPVNTEGELMRRWFGETDGHPGFQLMYLDKDSYLKEADGLSFWTRGKSRAQLLVRTNEPETRLELRLQAGHVPVTVRAALNGESQVVSLVPQQRGVLSFALPPGLPYKGAGNMSYVWKLAIETDNGWVPAEVDGGHDTRFLGVRVTPLIIREQP